ncbi:hypothetical protein D6C86_09553 [Aureobasidium pullulans]|uniref:Rhodopsin domain-containing protein n=1 Tax=Aureobasidium pullulans TaxID=5580 RepID=A0A4S9VPH1_AURPU|nr:hypothetical protein D6D15_09827 [Aureobasidium pullulans]THX83517.1 hypothetical protein D6D04_02933 [Aureobasidium pullulans]THZ54182.1 hypothetical protein D6C86_09553 [Aureobasidium pullulans]
MAIPVTVLFGNPPQDIDLSASNEILDDTVVAALTFLATMAVTSRLVIKKRKYGRLQADDWFILLALVCNHSNPGFEDTFAHIQQKFGEYGTAACTLAVWLPMTVACRPMDHFWNQYTGETNGSCINYLSMWIITGIFSAALDLLILLLPIPIIWSLKTHWSKKLPVSCLLALGTLVVIAAVIRLVYMSHMMHATDITWALGPAQIWTSLEPSLGIVSSCLITIFPPMVSGVRSILGLKRESINDRSLGRKLPSFGSMAPDPRCRNGNTFRFGVEEDGLALVAWSGCNQARITAVSGPTSSYGVAEGGIKVDKSFSVKGLEGTKAV